MRTLSLPSGGNVTGAVVTHDYRRAGSYTARLTVQDAAGQANSITKVVTVAK
jgi:PKD repeat protein